ncbi:MAG: hypothetical protein AAF734_02065 [Bacteroidota bacterium]
MKSYLLLLTLCLQTFITSAQQSFPPPSYFKQFEVLESVEVSSGTWREDWWAKKGQMTTEEVSTYIIPFLTPTHQLTLDRFDLSRLTTKAFSCHPVGQFALPNQAKALLVALDKVPPEDLDQARLDPMHTYFVLMYYDTARQRFLGYQHFAAYEEAYDEYYELNGYFQYVDEATPLVNLVFDDPFGSAGDYYLQTYQILFNDGQLQLNLVENDIWDTKKVMEKKGVAYRKECLDRVGCCFLLPYKVLDYIPFHAQDSRIGLYVSDDKQTQLKVFRLIPPPWIEQKTVPDLYPLDQELFSRDGYQITYDVFSKEKKWYVLSGYRADGAIFYYKVFEDEIGHIIQVLMTYPAAQKEQYDPIVSQLYSSFTRVK